MLVADLLGGLSYHFSRGGSLLIAVRYRLAFAVFHSGECIVWTLSSLAVGLINGRNSNANGALWRARRSSGAGQFPWGPHSSFLRKTHRRVQFAMLQPRA
jgi:hypothetical protein